MALNNQNIFHQNLLFDLELLDIIGLLMSTYQIQQGRKDQTKHLDKKLDEVLIRLADISKRLDEIERK